jgi:ferredoxin
MRLDIFLSCLLRRSPVCVRLVPARTGRRRRQARRPEAEMPALRRFLARLGPSWVRSPFRRIVQALALALFLALFLYVLAPPDSPRPAEAREAREFIDAESFLRLDPLVAITAAVAGRAWVSSLVWAGVLLAVTLVIPRGFCGYVCPLGTLTDLFDWLVGGCVKRFRVERLGWWVHIRHYVLAGVMAAAIAGVMLSGFVSAIPVLTRGILLIFGPLQTGLARGWHMLAPVSAGQVVSILLFLAVLALGLLGPRFWCRCVCPTGAVFSLVSLLRLTGRKVTKSCNECGKCVEACDFGAIRPDFTTRPDECTFCQTCGGACPVGAITFAGRWSGGETKPTAARPGTEVRLSRRGFIGGVLGGLAGAGAMRLSPGPERAGFPVRPPGSLPEYDFLARCVRCGECVKACSSGVLQPASFELGLVGLWTPRAACDRAGCHQDCNNCGQVCPTGAIRALPLDDRRAARMGLALVDRSTCLPHAGAGECRLCFDQCAAAGYDAIELARVHVEFDPGGRPAEGTGHLAPVVLGERCVGCGLCQSRCHGVNVGAKALLGASAIEVLAGPGREDRIVSGSYVELRRLRIEEMARRKTPPASPSAGRGRGESEESAGPEEVEYLPEFLR